MTHRNTHGSASLLSWMPPLAVATAISVAFAAPSAAETLRIAVGQADTHAHAHGLKNYAAYIQENTDLGARVFGAELLNLSEIPGGLRDGIVAVGAVVTAYKPAEYTEMNLIGDLSMLATVGEVGDVPAAAMSGAVMEYVHFHCPECLDQFEAQNQVFLASASTSPYILLCREPVETLEAMAGKKFRSGAANFGRWAEHVGGVKVSLPGNEIYDALAQGVVDCAMLSVTTLIEASHIDVTRALLFGVPGGVYAGLAENATNLDVWRGLSDEERAVMIRGSARLASDIVMHQRNVEIEATELAKSRGLKISEADAATMANYEEFVNSDLAVIASEMAAQGVQNAEAKVAQAGELIEKWKGLTAGISAGDVDQLADLYWNEIFSKLDPSTYGMQ
jgi:TRAP-type transport system periplasmic protein